MRLNQKEKAALLTLVHSRAWQLCSPLKPTLRWDVSTDNLFQALWIQGVRIHERDSVNPRIEAARWVAEELALRLATNALRTDTLRCRQQRPKVMSLPSLSQSEREVQLPMRKTRRADPAALF